MCNRFVPPPTLDTIDDEIRQLGIALEFPAGRPNMPPEYAIGDSPPVVLRAGTGLSLKPMTWAWKGPGGKPVFNFRSDGRTFGSSDRCLIPAAGFFEFTDAEPGHKRKTKWRFDLVGAPWMWIAGVVRQGAFALLTTEPGPDIAPYHERQVCVLAPGQALEWLDLTQAEGELLRPLPAGSLSVTKVYPDQGAPLLSATRSMKV